METGRKKERKKKYKIILSNHSHNSFNFKSTVILSNGKISICIHHFCRLLYVIQNDGGDKKLDIRQLELSFPTGIRFCRKDIGDHGQLAVLLTSLHGIPGVMLGKPSRGPENKKAKPDNRKPKGQLVRRLDLIQLLACAMLVCLS
ncbi:hypothetical protein CEXT_638141 [Caerostris extrusa]|uniref:Uncharacterized protein n=1 Tax=Caerostris extrusa TaxID=172846 RepID=A0AAV4Q350_CAEEX|nr:hypothetical protein CEXT_638141 [Caerostris extrusa]